MGRLTEGWEGADEEGDQGSIIDLHLVLGMADGISDAFM